MTDIDVIADVAAGVDAELIQNGEVLKAWLAERERAGLDERDEFWNGVLHLVPAANGDHQVLGSWLLENLAPVARQAGLQMTYETGLFAAANDYKVPDLVAASPAHRSKRGAEVGAELVIEIQSPGDETLDKIPWYLDNGTTDLVIIHRDTLAVQVFSQPAWDDDDSGWLRLRSLPGVAFRSGGPEIPRLLELRLPDGIVARADTRVERYPS